MKSLELHVLEQPNDIDLAALAGLIELTDNELCESCGSEVGYDRLGNFTPICVVIDAEQEWVVCLDCAEPIIDPSIYEAAEDSVSEFEDFEDDELEL